MSGPEQPTLNDGVVVLRPWRDSDIDVVHPLADDEMVHWFGFPGFPPRGGLAEAVEEWRQGYADERRVVNFLVERDGRPVGNVEVRDQGDALGELSWTIYAPYRGRGYGTHAVRLLVQYCFDELGMQRIQAYVEQDNRRSLRVAMRAGLRKEGVTRGRSEVAGARRDFVLLGRLASDLDPGEPEGFRALLNSALPRKRAIAQMAIRDENFRLLMCHTTYKPDWDLPGGVVEDGESPRAAARREVSEELAFDVTPGRLLVVDWLPTWGGWDDACTFVFDGGVHQAGMERQLTFEPREIRGAEFCDPDQIRERCADFTVRRILAILAATTSGTRYLENGYPLDEA
ncbi:MAG: GNAT family N-acetyltransferase [Propionibacteriales bacterium]|nr:GNAT family N-acetyltransferase [Propionibacteriales bacterium]